MSKRVRRAGPASGSRVTAIASSVVPSAEYRKPVTNLAEGGVILATARRPSVSNTVTTLPRGVSCAIASRLPSGL